MKISFLLVFCCYFAVTKCDTDAKLHHIVSHVNNANAPWKAGINSFHTNDYKKLVGTFHHPDSGGQVLDPFNREIFGDNVGKGSNYDTDPEDDETNIEETFDARYHWFNCPSISHIWNQGNCAADWAIAPTSVMNDRICIESQGNITALYSPQKVISCCAECGDGCNGGYTASAWKYILKRGLVTGGDYGSNQGCQPWLVPPCNVSATAQSGSVLGPRTCGGDHMQKSTTPKCDLSCYNSKYDGSYIDDIIKAEKVYTFCGGTARKILKKHGPYAVTMRVYEDFLTYKTGVYQHVTGDYLGMLSVRLIGWGIERGQTYWLLANSWGTSWGNKGFFKIRRYVNECWIENIRYAGNPKL